MVIDMKKNCKFQIEVFTLLLLVVSCTNTTNNNNSNIKNPQKSNVVVIDTILNSKASTVLNEHEIIGGWLKESIEQHVVIDKLGLPEKKGEDEYWGATGTYVQNWDYTSLGIILEMESENQDGIKKVRSIIIIYPCKLKTIQGVGIGSDEKTVREKYLKLIDASNSSTKSIVVGSIYGGTIFTLDNGIVNKIFIGATAE
jgi:hypothetical protein